jgi:tape measure domain-containing protein
MLKVRSPPNAQANAGALRGAASGAKAFNDEVDRTESVGRRALSVSERLRSEVLGLIAAYIGFNAALGQITSIVDAYQQVQAAQNRLGVVFGSTGNKVQQELNFIRDQADRLGISFNTLADQYGKFAVAANEANFTNEATRKIFLAVAEAARVNKLSVGDTEGVFLALTQMISKGTVSSEELRRQLGDRLPGAFNIFADALGISTKQLDKFMREGRIAADENTLLKFADELNTKFGPQLGESLQSISAQIGRLQNTIFNARVDVGSSGFIASLSTALQSLNTYFTSEDGERFFAQLGAALGRFVDILAKVPQYFGEIQVAISTLVAVKLGSFLADIVTRFGATTGAVKAFEAELAFVGPRMVEMTTAQRIFGQGFAQIVSSIDAYRASLLASTSLTSTARIGLLGLNGALGIVRTTMIAVASVSRALWLAIGGLPGIILTGIVFAVGTWLTSIDDASLALTDHERHVDTIVAAYENAKNKAADWAKEIKGVTLSQAQADVVKFGQAYSEALGKISAQTDGVKQRLQFFQGPVGALRGANLIAPEDKAGMDALVKAMDDLKGGVLTLDQFKEVLDGVSKSVKDETLKDLAVQLQDSADGAKGAEKNFQNAKDAVTIMSGSADDAAAAYRRLRGEQDKTAVSTKGAADALADYETALDKIAKLVPSLADKMKELKQQEVVDQAFIDGLAAIGKMGLQSATAIDAMTERLQKMHDLAKDAINAEDITKDLDKVDGALAKSTSLIARMESLSTAAFKDNDGKFRVGFSSDTQTSPSGQVTQTTKDSVSSLDDALRDLNRRVGNYFDEIKSKIGETNFDKLSGDQQAVLASIVHNYGELPKRIVDALKTGDASNVADAIKGLGTDNGGINAKRRDQESSIFRNSDVSGDVDKQIKQLDELNKKQADFKTSLDERVVGYKEEAQARQESNREGEITKAINEQETAARKAGLPVLVDGSRLTKEQTQALRDSVGARYDSLHAGEAEKEQRKTEQETLQNLIGLDQQRTTALKEFNDAMKEGDTDKQDEMRKKVQELNDAIANGIPLARQLADALGDEKGIAAIDKVRLHTHELNFELTTAKQINGLLAEGLTTAFSTAAQGIGQAVVGAKSWGDALGGVRNAFLKFASDFLIQIGEMILKQIILNALSSAFGGGGGIGGILSTAINALVLHEGGLVTAGGGPSRSISPTIFQNAVRYHSGGIVGLRPNEVPAILQRNEEVLKASDPRHILNGGGVASGGAGGAPAIRNILVLDPKQLTEALSNSHGEKLVVNHIKNNATAVRRILG